jgi:DNA modification methylase
MSSIRIEYTPLTAILKAPRNPKTHRIDKLDESIGRFGFVQPLTLNEATGRLVAGHGRLETLAKMKADGKAAPDRITVAPDGEWLVPVTRGVSFASDAEAEAFLIADNRISEIGGWDDKMLSEMLKDLSTVADGFVGLGYMPEDLTTMLKGLGDVSAPPVGADEVPDNVTPRSQVGDLWVLGKHRILCGDSTNHADVTRLMGGKTALLMATDPPYGVAYTDTVRSDLKGTEGKWDLIAGDGRDVVELDRMLAGFLTTALAYALAQKAAIYIWHSSAQAPVFIKACLDVGMLIHNQIIWAKPSIIFGASDYHWQHEPCLYGWIKGERPPFYGERNQGTVWNITHEVSNGQRVHPTQKPVEVFTRAMVNHTRLGDICYEPFSGSGSQIIAAEKLDRRCFAMELNPTYVDAALARWEAFTGQVAVKESP